jgi:uncharacterized protein with NRDE domain
MCTFVILRRSNHAWPVLIAANRDENYGRKFEKPDHHWPDVSDVVGGWDATAHGSWFAINEAGVTAAILNRADSTGPHPNKRSRGELVIESLTHADASAAAESMAMIDPAAYAPFNLVIADNTFACWLKNDGHKIEVAQIPEGYSMLTTHDRNDYSMPRIRNYLPRFQTAKIPDPESNDWRDWQVLMGQRLYSATDGPYSAMCIVDESSRYGTVCSQLLAIPHVDRRIKPIFLFANGRPGEAPFEFISL